MPGNNGSIRAHNPSLTKAFAIDTVYSDSISKPLFVRRPKCSAAMFLTSFRYQGMRQQPVGLSGADSAPINHETALNVERPG